MQQPAARTTLRDTAYDTIRRMIVRGELKPGQPLTVNELASALAIGRTPVIQAIDRLAVDGLVDVLPRKGVLVSPVSYDELVEVIQMRVINEIAAVRLAARRAAQSDIARMRDNLEATRAAARDRDVDSFVARDREFHALITQAAGNRILHDVLANLHDRAQRFWFTALRAPDQNVRVCNEHGAIVDAMAAGDPELAEKAMRDHIASFEANATSQIARG